MFLTIVAFVVVLSLLVFVHEFGHFWVARKMGVKAEEFGFGFPPRLAGFYKDQEGKWRTVSGNKEVKDASDTIYSLNWIPLGGFVKIKGENGEDEKDEDSFSSHPIWQRVSIISAGVIMNVLLAAVLISIGLMIGLPQSVENLSSKAKVSEQHIQILQVLPNSPAENAGIKMGDVIVSINGNDLVKSEELQNYIDSNVGKELDIVLKRRDESVSLTTVPEMREDTGRGGIGIAISEVGLVKYPWYLAIWEGLKTTIYLLWAILVAFYYLIKGLILGQGVGAEVAGPVGIASLTGQFARMGFVYLLQFTALLSINLAIINFLPFPALDGGRLLFLMIEKIKGSPVKREIEATIHNIGFALLMLLVLVVTFKDVARFGDKFKMLFDKIF